MPRDEDRRLCFHFTKTKYLEQIRKEGLRPQYGTNCKILGDMNGTKISYSIGCQNAVKMFYALNEVYKRVKDGRVREETFDESHKKLVEDIQNSKDFESWEEDGVYLVFNRDSIQDETRCNNQKEHDAWSDGFVPAKDLMVFIIIDKSKGGKIVSFSKYDVVAFMASRLEEPVFGFYKYDIEDRIEEFSKPQYDVALMSLEEFLILTKKRKVDVDR